MKPFYCIDITNNSENTKTDCEEFVTARAPKELLNEYNRKSFDLREKSKLANPLWLYCLKCFTGVIGTTLLLFTFINAVNEGLVTVFKEHSNMVILGIVLISTFTALHLISKRQRKKLFNGMTQEEAESEVDRLYYFIQSEMGVPKVAVDTDIFTFKYKIYNGIDGEALLIQDKVFPNRSFRAYSDENALYLADDEMVYSFEKKDMMKICTVNEKMRIMFWNKDGEPDDGRFDDYISGVGRFSFGNVDKYHILYVKRDGEVTGIYFPSYELPAFERLTGLTAER